MLLCATAVTVGVWAVGPLVGGIGALAVGLLTSAAVATSVMLARVPGSAAIPIAAALLVYAFGNPPSATTVVVTVTAAVGAELPLALGGWRSFGPGRAVFAAATPMLAITVVTLVGAAFFPRWAPMGGWEVMILLIGPLLAAALAAGAGIAAAVICLIRARRERRPLEAPAPAA